MIASSAAAGNEPTGATCALPDPVRLFAQAQIRKRPGGAGGPCCYGVCTDGNPVVP